MNGAFFLRPGVWLMRRLHLGGKLLLLGAVAGGLVLSLVWLAGAADRVVVWAWAALGLLVLGYLLLSLYLSQTGTLRRITRAMEQVSQGDLRARVAIQGHDELARMAQLLDGMVLTLSCMVADIRSNAALVAHAGQVLAHDSRALAERTEQQASSLQQTSASVAALSAAVGADAQTAHQADTQASQVRGAVESGVQAMERAVHSVEAIQQGARRMGEIIGVIDSIAFQTNILALNAAVEAARAGEQGRGFAVVASEVRSLAQRSAEAAREIRQLIGASVQQVEGSVGLMRTAGEGIAGMAEGIRTVAHNMTELAQSGQRQQQDLAEISAAVQQLDGITQHNAEMVDAAVHEAQALEQRAATLSHAVESFRLQQGTAEEAMALVQRAMALTRSGLGQVQVLQQLTDKAQPYHDRDMYVFALDASGAYRAFGGNPAKVGTRVQDVPGVDGPRLLHDIMAQSERGPGWVEYDFTNPVSGQVQTKMTYVQRWGDLAIGCGVYKSFTT